MKQAMKRLSIAISLSLLATNPLWAEGLTVLHIGDQESWLISA